MEALKSMKVGIEDFIFSTLFLLMWMILSILFNKELDPE